MSSTLTGILFLVAVLVVAALITVDVLRTPDELTQEHADRQVYETERPIIGTPRDAGARAFPAEPGVTAAAGHDGGQRARADGVSPAAGGHRRPGTWSATQHKDPRGALKNWPVRMRLFLLVLIPAVAAAVVTLSVVRIVSSLRGASIHSQVSSVHDGAIVWALVAGAVLIVVLALALWFAIAVTRSVVQPLLRLRARTVEVADVQLPHTVRLISESDGEGGPPDVDPIAVDSSDEIGDVARAFDQVHREVLRLAADEAAIRGKINSIFANLSRRSQALVERQIRIIDELEKGEQQAERRVSLFKLDHLVTRMRRYSQNLLILAGHHESAGRSSQPMALVNVIRVAVSEIEDYERVSLNAQSGIAVSGPAVDDVVHVLTELVENATALSAGDTPVLISGRMLASGGALIDITDRGFGMGAEELAYANWRLDNPPTADITVFKSMGLSVVGRLAARHGIRIRLRAADSGGLTALVWLPNAILMQQQEPPPSPGFGGFGAVRSAPNYPEPARHGRPVRVDPDHATVE
jgi:signal transduction histidine kinase